MNDDCTQLHEVAPELALGVLVGAERGQALAHLAGCAECRQHVDELSRAADSLLLLAAEAEPPLGFESRVLERLGADQRRQRPWRWIATAAAAVVLTAAATGIVVHQLDTPAGNLQLRTGALLAGSGQETGDVYITAGRPGWVFMSIESATTGQSYDCELHFADGHIVNAGRFTVAGRKGWWGTVVKPDAGDLRSIRLVATDGITIATAEFS